MRFVQFYYNNEPKKLRVGYMEGDAVVDINKNNPTIPNTLLGILRKRCTCDVTTLKNSKPPVEPMGIITLVAPITGMDKVLCIGRNYYDSCTEINMDPPTIPSVFTKFASTIIGQNEPVRLRTDIVHELDWEVELAVVIGKKCTNVKAVDAFSCVFGYTIAQDITSRDWSKLNGGQLTLGKSQDTFCPLGPCVVTADELGDPHNLDIKCMVNGVWKQQSNTSNFVHKIPDIVERITSVLTLLPGDIILTGTPSGVGENRDPPQFLKPGDIIRSDIQHIGTFTIKVEKF